MFYYVKKTKAGKVTGYTSGGSFSADMRRWVVFFDEDVQRITRPYGCKGGGHFIDLPAARRGWCVAINPGEYGVHDWPGQM